MIAHGHLYVFRKPEEREGAKANYINRLYNIFKPCES